MSDGLYVPEEHLKEVIEVIRVGLKNRKTSRDVKRNLNEWCKEMEEYIQEQEEYDDEDEIDEKPIKKKK